MWRCAEEGSRDTVLLAAAPNTDDERRNFPYRDYSQSVPKKRVDLSLPSPSDRPAFGMRCLRATLARDHGTRSS